MKKDNVKMEDELRPEYDLMSLKVRKVGPERKNFFGITVRLEADVAKVFPDSGSVNEALRFLIRTIQKISCHSLVQQNRDSDHFS
ncbi:BrnA antitoxin family protein [Thermodesulfovibrionales bacterium]|nr:BrnA antitoxin family protein [Thermodesulfovibrionales bacterium]